MSISFAPFSGEFSEEKFNKKLDLFNKDYILSFHTGKNFSYGEKRPNFIDSNFIYLFQWLKKEYNFISKAKIVDTYFIRDSLCGMSYIILSDKTSLLVKHGSGRLYTAAFFSKLNI